MEEITDPTLGLAYVLENEEPNLLYQIIIGDFEDSYNVGVFSDVVKCFDLVDSMVKSNRDFIKESKELALQYQVNKCPTLDLERVDMLYDLKDYELSYGLNKNTDGTISHCFYVSDREFFESFSISIVPLRLNVLTLPDRIDFFRQNDEVSKRDVKNHLEDKLEDYLEYQSYKKEQIEI